MTCSQCNPVNDDLVPLHRGIFEPISGDPPSTVDMPSIPIITFSAFDKCITLIRGTSGHYSGSYQCSFNYSRLGAGDINFTATKGGWHSNSNIGSVSFAGTLLALVMCGKNSAQNGSMLTIKGSIISVETIMKVKLGATESPAQSLQVSVVVYAGGTRVANITLAAGTPGVYAGSCAMRTAGTYMVEVVLQGTVLVRFAVTLDGARADTPDLMDLGALPVVILVSSAVGGLAVIGIGKVSRKKAIPKDRVINRFPCSDKNVKSR